MGKVVGRIHLTAILPDRVTQYLGFRKLDYIHGSQAEVCQNEDLYAKGSKATANGAVVGATLEVESYVFAKIVATC